MKLLLILCTVFSTLRITAVAASEAPSPGPTRGPGVSQSAAPQTEDHTALETVLVTGSLIPQIREENAAPLTVITAEDMQSRGFATLAEALQQTSFATGSVSNNQFTGGFTPGAQTLSMFGLSPSYVKYLIDGRPMSNYPALYNATDVITNLQGVPEELIDRIEVPPGGQSSLYGSDAIAGVVNIILRKRLDGPVVDFRYGFFDHGGGVSKRLVLADSFTLGALTVLAGVQWDRKEPIWGYQRTLTASYYGAGSTPITAERDYLVYGLGDGNGTYYFLDPSQCAHVAGQFGASVREYSRPGLGNYCGTTRSGYNTLDNADRSIEGYLHATDDLSDNTQVYLDVLANHDRSEFSNGPQGLSSDIPYYWYYDPNLGDLIVLQHLLSPEEVGGLSSTLSKVTTNTYRVAGGLQGHLGASDWSYDIDLSHAQQGFVKNAHVMFRAPVTAYFDSILGPDLGPDPFLGLYPTFAPDYAAFYNPITPRQYAQFADYVNAHARSADNLLRAQLTNATLLSLPGGKAALAAVVEYGQESWRFAPDPRVVAGEVYGYVAVSGSGHRSRYALTSELRLPVLPQVTVSASTRFDDYRVAGQDVDKLTYSLGLEIRPVPSILLRGRYGTAFKAPTLADEFQGPSAFANYYTDYFGCSQLGFSGSTIGNCPYYSAYATVSTAGNLKLKPITADVWSVGVVWSPLQHTSLSADVLHWSIANEVAPEDGNQLLRTESNCRLGVYDIQSPTCVAATSQVTRDPTGVLLTLDLPKVNVSREIASAVTVRFVQQIPLGRAGNLSGQASWSDLLKHTSQLYAGDPYRDLLRDPIASTDFKTKANASLTWSKSSWSSTFYVDRLGRSPNSIANFSGYATSGAGTVAPWTLCNLNLRYQWASAVGVSLTVDNVFDRMPPADHSYSGDTSQPYNGANFNVYGRAYYLEVSYHPRR